MRIFAQKCFTSGIAVSELMPILWYGMTDKATKYLEELQEGLIKDRKALTRLINYIDRNREFIPLWYKKEAWASQLK